MIVLVDTDILIDVALDRRPHVESAGELLDALEQRPGTGLVAWHSIANFHYLVTPSRGRVATKQLVLDLIEFIDVAPTTTLMPLRTTGSKRRYGRRSESIGRAYAAGSTGRDLRQTLIGARCKYYEA